MGTFEQFAESMVSKGFPLLPTGKEALLGVADYFMAHPENLDMQGYLGAWECQSFGCIAGELYCEIQWQKQIHQLQTFDIDNYHVIRRDATILLFGAAYWGDYDPDSNDEIPPLPLFYVENSCWDDDLQEAYFTAQTPLERAQAVYDAIHRFIDAFDSAMATAQQVAVGQTMEAAGV